MNDAMNEFEKNQDNGSVPFQVTRWNWGAFFWTWVWGIRFGVWKSFLIFIPIFNIFWWFILGAKGSEWAWRSYNWRNIEEFQRSQRRWALSGLIVLVAVIVILVVFLKTMSGAVKPMVDNSFRMVQQNVQIQQYIGSSKPIERNMVTYINIDSSNGQTSAEIKYSITGANATMNVSVRGEKINGEWQIGFLKVYDRSRSFLLVPSSSSAQPVMPKAGS